MRVLRRSRHIVRATAFRRSRGPRQLDRLDFCAQSERKCRYLDMALTAAINVVGATRRADSWGTTTDAVRRSLHASICFSYLNITPVSAMMNMSVPAASAQTRGHQKMTIRTGRAISSRRY